ncbi:MAG: NTP transferase domain-containing protein [Patescibacteria group bacterium]|jgi:bifunctional UDP-N-acetylglucosamine pyrophosphorylase/glucosamine-1-phosphate N-acetyltransferase
MGKIQIIILAAGHGKRMNNAELPKVLVPFKGKPLISRLLQAIKASGVCAKPAIVVGQKADMIKAALGSDYTYIFQAEQLGTGHAVMCSKDELAGKAENIMVLYGDHPLVSAETIKKIAAAHLETGAILTMATVTIPDFSDWRANFYDFGRIIRTDSGRVCAIVEKKDAAESQKEIKEVNPSYLCFQAEWLWENLAKLKNDNAQKEYYLTDLIGSACRQSQEITTVEIRPEEALGVNTAEQLELINKI